jgi:ankyrin repeat protein
MFTITMNRAKQADVKKNGPLAFYAAEYWVRHAQFEDVASRMKGMEYLFDPDKPYFAAWRKLHDMDIVDPDSVFYRFTSWESDGTPLYYAALCGFRNIVDRLIVKHPKHVRAIGGYHFTPAVAALAGRHFELAQVLRRKGSSVNPRGAGGNFPLHSAVDYMDLETVQVLVDCGVDVNARNDDGRTPLSYALWDAPTRPTNPGVVRCLLNHGADPNVRDIDGKTSLHLALESGRIEIARLLVEHGASVKVKDKEGRTALDSVSGEQRDEIRKLYSAKRERDKCCIM